mgnify:CR=1 FL=1
MSYNWLSGISPAQGHRAGNRHSVGTGVMGGMMAATFLAIFFVPLFFYWLTERRVTEKRSRDQLKEEIDQHRQVEHGASQMD